MQIKKNNKRIVYLLLLIVTVPIGLATRSATLELPTIIKTYGGDTLYATMMFWLVRLIAIEKSLVKVAIIALLACFFIEILQLYQADWIQSIRHTFPFGLILGYGFLWSDWLCYAVGVLLPLMIAVLVEKTSN